VARGGRREGVGNVTGECAENDSLVVGLGRAVVVEAYPVFVFGKPVVEEVV